MSSPPLDTTLIPLKLHTSPDRSPAGPDESKIVMDEVDERGDFIFRFEIDPGRDDELTLREFYRAHLHELMGVVRFYFDGRPVILDSFAFLNAPEDVIPIQPEDGRLTG
jgi:hypothetical protein